MARYEISNWFDRGCAKGARYMCIYWDSFDHDDGHYPMYFADAESYYQRPWGDTLMEVYDLHMDKETQLNQHRANNGPGPRRRSARLAAKVASKNI